MKVDNTSTDHNRTLRFRDITYQHGLNDGNNYLREMLVTVNYVPNDKPQAVVLDNIIIPAIINAINGEKP